MTASCAVVAINTKLAKPFNRTELKDIARVLRRQTLNGVCFLELWSCNGSWGGKIETITTLICCVHRMELLLGVSFEVKLKFIIK